MSLKAVEKLEREQMAAMGLVDFETGDDCQRRQLEMMKRLRAEGLAEYADQVVDCTLYNCAAEPCREGCYFASSTRRLETISSAHGIFVDHPGPVYQTTIVLPRWELPPGRLHRINLSAMRQWAARVLKSIEVPGLVAVGIVEASFNVELSGESFWSPEIQMVVAGASRQDLKDAFKVPAAARRRKHERPVMVSEIGCLGRHLGYAQKHHVCERRAYVSPTNGRQHRRKVPPRSAVWAEYDAWLLSLPVGARTIAFGCARHGQLLFPLK